MNKLYQTGEEFELRRPHVTEGGIRLTPGQRLRIVAEEQQEDYWLFTLVVLDAQGQVGDVQNPEHVLSLSQGWIRRDCRRAVWQQISKPVEETHAPA